MTALVLSLLAAAPPAGPSFPGARRFVLEVAGLPIAELRVEVSGDRYLYESTHFFEETQGARRVTLPLGEQAPTPEVLALLRRPATGCRDVLEERTGVLERLCVERSTAREVSGTLAGEAFVAHYDPAAALLDITVGAARWVATTEPTTPPPQSPFALGLVVPEGPLRLTPGFAGTRWLARPPLGIGTPARVGRARCLVLAREEAARRPDARVSVGLVIEEGRAYPHAWITEAGEAFDPSVLPTDAILAQRRYLEVPTARSGAFFLQLFGGALRLKAK